MTPELATVPMLTVLAGVAEYERDLIRARTSEGRERAKALGVKMGRKPNHTHQVKEALRRYQLPRAQWPQPAPAILRREWWRHVPKTA